MVAGGSGSGAVVARLAEAHGDVAVFAHKWGVAGDAATLDQMIGPRPQSLGATPDWMELSARLPAPAVEMERSMDLSR